MSRTQWRSVRRVLMVIARHYPTAVPSVARIADQAKLSVRQVQRILGVAEVAGLLVIKHDGGRGRHHISKTSRYHIAALMVDVRGDISGEEMSHEGSPSENYLTPFGSSSSDSVLPSVARKAAAAARGPWREPEREVGPPSDPDELVLPDGPDDDRPDFVAPPELQAIMRKKIDEANVYGRKKRSLAQRKRPASHTEQLIEYFQAEWKSLVNAHPELVNLKAGSAGEIGRYIKTQLLDGKQGVEYTPDQIRTIIDDFMVRVASGEIVVRPGKPACRSFANHWKPLQPEINYDEMEALRARNK